MNARQRLLLRSLRAISLSACLACIASSISSAAPPGVNLSWNDCGIYGEDSRVFACDTNVGNHTLVGSFSSPVALDSLNGNEMVLEIQGSAAAFAPWWQIKNNVNGATGCRNGAGSSNFDFTASPFNCHDYWQGQALGGLSMLYTINGYPQNRQRILLVCAIRHEQAVPLAAELETYSFKLIVSNTKTVGAGACTGCLDQADIWLQSIRLTLNYDPSGPNHDVLLDYASTRNYVSWRPGTVATRNASWGAIKSMYR